MVTPTRITLARRRRGLTVIELSRRVGVSAQSMSNYERGRQQPSPETLERIARELQFPTEFFEGSELDELPEASVAFRARSKLAAGKRDAALGSARIAVELNSWIEDRFRLPSADVPTLDRPDPETAADMVRSRWGLGVAPLPNIVHLLEAHGVRVYSLATEHAEVDAFSFWRGGTPFVFLNTMKSGERGRFDAAHELGHLVLHSGSRGLHSVEAEQEANAFAGAFLMPRTSVAAHMPQSPFVDQIIQGKKIWKVAALALTYRLHDLGMLSEWHYRTACKELSKRGYRSREPQGIPRETSQLLNKVLGALRAKGVAANDVAAGLSIEPDELNRLVFGLVVTSIEGGGGRRTTQRARLTVVPSGVPSVDGKPQSGSNRRPRAQFANGE